MLFEQEIAKHNCHSLAPNLSRFIGMVERGLASIYDLLPLTLGDTDSKSSSEGSCHQVRESNMLHLLGNGVATEG